MSIATIPILKICTPPPEKYTMTSCIGNCLAGDVAKSHARLALSASYRSAFSSEVSALTARELAVLLDLVLCFDV
jgi:hypothetical protein